MTDEEFDARYGALASAAQPAAVPPGYVLAPVDPSDKMVQAALHIDLSYMPGQDGADRAAVYRAMLAAAPKAAPAQPAQHPDDAAVDALAMLMKAKLAKQRAKGYGGWDSAECKQEWLSALLREHVIKGDPVDVANFCAFLSARGEVIAPSPAEALREAEMLFAKAPQPAVQQGGWPTMDDAIAAGDGTLHGAIDHWQQRALAAERVLVSRDAVLEEAAKACEAREALAGRADMKATCRLCAKAVRALKTHAAPQPAVQQGDAARVINAAREAMDESFEAGNDAMDISIPSHLAAALSLALDEYDAARHAAPAAQGDALIDFIESAGSVHIHRVRAGFNGPIRWDVEYGYEDAKVSGRTLRDALSGVLKAGSARAAKEGGEA